MKNTEFTQKSFQSITKYKSYFSAALLLVLLLVSAKTYAQILQFESLSSLLGTNQFWNGSGGTVEGVFETGSVRLPNTYNTAFGGYWQRGWALSKVSNTTLAGATNLYAAIAGNAGGNYLVGQQYATLSFTGITTVTSITYTNSTYAYWSMKNGDNFARSFSGIKNDYFYLRVYPIRNGIIDTSIYSQLWLADFTSATGTNTIVNSWQESNLTTLGGVNGLSFQLFSSDTGANGMNTPAFFCIKSITGATGVLTDLSDITLSSGNFLNKTEADFANRFTEGFATFPSTYAVRTWGDYWKNGFAISQVLNTTQSGSGNLYGNIAGRGASQSQTFIIGQQGARLIHATTQSVSGFYVTNTTYAYWSMKNGDSFAKKFGGPSGTDPDFFKLSIIGYRNGLVVSDTASVYLADFRNTDKDTILNSWQWVSLEKLGQVDSVQFNLSSSDVGAFGINTPLFFAMDAWNSPNPNLTTTIEPAKTQQTIRIFPNPATNYLEVNGNLTTSTQWRILNMLGSITSEGSVTKVNNQIDISSLPQGSYILAVEHHSPVRFIKTAP